MASSRYMIDTDVFSYVVNDRYPGLRVRFVGMARGYTLVTNNTAHFSRVSGLKLENWIQGN